LQRGKLVKNESNKKANEKIKVDKDLCLPLMKRDLWWGY